MTDCIQVVTTTDTRDNASKIAKHLLDLRLAGCVQVGGPITSSYWWKGKIENTEEWYCVIKTLTERYEDVEQGIRAIHSYKEPEILALHVVFGSKTYIEWLADSVKG